MRHERGVDCRHVEGTHAMLVVVEVVGVGWECMRV